MKKMNLNVRYCKKCKGAYDIATNFDECPKCRGTEINEEVTEEKCFGQ